MKAKKETGAKPRRIWSSLLAVMLVASVLVLPASANSREKNHDYLDWLIFDSEILNVEWEAYQDWPDDVIATKKVTFYRPIIYVPLGSVVQVKDELLEQYYCMTNEFSTPLLDDKVRDDFLRNKIYADVKVNSTEPIKFGICHYDETGWVDIYGKDHLPIFKYTFYIVGVDTSTPKPTNDFTSSIPGLEQYVRFSTSYVSTDKNTVMDDLVTDENGNPQIVEKEITVYEFPVGTKLRLTEQAINNGYTISNMDSFAESETFQTELTISGATTREKTYFANSPSNPEGFTFYIRPVNVNAAFNDVLAGAYYNNAVKWAVKYGITDGTSATTFSPNQTCTTAQILTFLWRANGGFDIHISEPFNDVSKSDYFYDAALWAKDFELVEGNFFNPNTPCTRSMVVTYLWKLAGEPSVTPSNFTDVPTSADYSQAVAWAVRENITNGTSATTFSPNDICTRGQIVTFIYRAMGK